MLTPSRVLFLGGSVYSAQDPSATALLVDGGIVAWVGSDSSARALFSDHTDLLCVELEGHLVTPSFVDGLPRGSGASPEDGVTDAVENDRGIAPALEPDCDFLAYASQGAPLVFGSGGQSGSPWGWVHAAAVAAPSEQRLSARAAFLASTRAGRRLQGIDHPGSLEPGTTADLVVWEPWDLIVCGNDERIQTWSTDPRSRTPRLPDLSSGRFPRPVMAMARGHIVHNTGTLPALTYAAQESAST